MSDSKALAVPDFVVLSSEDSNQMNNQAKHTQSHSNSQSFNQLANGEYDYDQIAFRDLNKLQFYSLMTGFALSIRCLTYPMTLIKTRQQTQQFNISSSQPHNLSIHKSIRAIIDREGVRGLYRGLRLNLVTLSVSPVYITTLEMTRDALNQTIDQSTNLSSNQSVRHAVPFISGLVGSIVAQSLAVPLDVITQRQMIGKDQTSARSIFRNLVARDGWLGLWRGYSLSIISAAPYSAILWGVFHSVKTFLRQQFPIDQLNNLPIIQSNELINQSTGQANNQINNQTRTRWTGYSRELLIIPVSAACGSSLASVLTMPLDVMRTRIQTSNERASFSVVFKKLIAERGVRGLMSGVTARVAGAAPSSALMMSSYELVKRICLVEEPSER